MNRSFQHMHKIAKAIYIMKLAEAGMHGRLGSNSRAYRIMYWALKRYDMDDVNGWALKSDVINGYV